MAALHRELIEAWLAERVHMKSIVVLFASALTAMAAVPFDISGPVPGSIAVSSTADSALVTWKDKAGRPCSAQFSLDPAKPLITSIAVNGKTVISRAQPVYRASTGKRRGGFDQFFDFPPSHPEGTRSFLGDFKLTAAHARFEGDRLDISFDGLALGIFHGGHSLLLLSRQHAHPAARHREHE